MSMFCFQCQETAGGKGCTVRGVCGKTEEVAKLQDLLIYTLKGISQIFVREHLDASLFDALNGEVLTSLFMTITTANFDDAALEAQIRKMLALRDALNRSTVTGWHDAALFTVGDRASMLEKAANVGVLATPDEDVRSLREMVVYGAKGIAAYAEHARNLGAKDASISAFLYQALADTLDDSLTADELTALVLKTGETGVRVMALLDGANTARYGSPVITKVNIGVRKNPAILISGHDLRDMEMLLEQTKNSGVDVYTHSEMLPAHAYPDLKKYPHLAGNYGNAWLHQHEEFETFNGPILFTTNCLVPPRSTATYNNRVFTTGPTGMPGWKHIDKRLENGQKDFSEIIELALKCPPPTEIEKGELTIGFAHTQVLSLADKILAAVKSGAIKKMVVMSGCDARQKTREYYTEFARKLPPDTVILTSGCAKYRYNKLGLGDIGGIPRVLDAGQCNDYYSWAFVALKLKEVLNLADINQLPIVFNIAWYEQKAIIVHLALLSLGIKNTHIGPTLPGFMTPNLLKIVKEKFGVQTITTVEEDMKIFGIG